MQQTTAAQVNVRAPITEWSFSVEDYKEKKKMSGECILLVLGERRPFKSLCAARDPGRS